MEVKRIVVFVEKSAKLDMEAGVVIPGWAISHQERIGKVFSVKELDTEEVKFASLVNKKLNKIEVESLPLYVNNKFIPYYIEVEKGSI